MIEIIAELGSSPAPDWNLARWCSVAARAGATAAKCQLWEPEHFGPAEAELKRPYRFPRQLLPKFVEAAHDHGLKAGVSVFDTEAVELAAKHCDFLKLAAREVRNGQLAVETMTAGLRVGKPVYRSVPDCGPWGHTIYGPTQLRAIPQYPAPLITSVAAVLESSLRWRNEVWGYSSHTRSFLDCWLAAKLGAVVVEKHLALSPDDMEAGHSLLPDAFRRMTRAING